MKKFALLTLIGLGFITTISAKEVFITANEIIVFIADDYEKVSSSELTPAVVEELLKQYPTSKLGGVYRNSKGEFKLIMVLKSGTRRTVFIDPYGNWIDKKKK
ncbi:hypothetical protein ACOCEA_06120 [Maribacter sp. CXY002]|uniref:hypothetical protein n=1 Tax=Maribacter luteocoastalis TaxID=3407671 RepID=UPI003B66F373